MKTIVTLCAWASCLLAVTFAQGASTITGYNANVSETNAVAAVQIERTGDLEATATLDYYTADGTATNGGDYVATSGTLTFLPGVSNLTVSVPLMNDALRENSEYFTLVLTNATGGAAISGSPPRIYINDNDLGIHFSSQYYTNAENSGFAVLTVMRGEDENFPASVTYSTANMTALAGTDYVATNGILEFAADELSKTLAIQLIDDLVPESGESFRLQLGTVTGATTLGTPSVALIRTEDNDLGIQLERTLYLVSPTAEMVTVTVLADPSLTEVVTVSYHTTNGTAVAGVDYVATSGTLTFTPGQSHQTINVPLLKHIEPFYSEKQFSFVLGAVIGPTGPGTNKTAIIRLQSMPFQQQQYVATRAMIPYFVDIDGDGNLEIVISGETDNNTPCVVYRHDGQGGLMRITNNLFATTSIRWGLGFAWADFDGDGDLDCYAATVNPAINRYFRNNGQGDFEVFNADRNWTVNGRDVIGGFASTADWDNDGILDILVGYYGDFGGFYGTNGVLHGVEPGRFEVLTNSPLALSRTWPETTTWADYDDDGDMDLFIITTGGSNYFMVFQNQGSNNFSQVYNRLTWTTHYGVGISWGDYDNDGDLDVFTGNHDEANTLYKNLGGGTFAPDYPGAISGNKWCGGWADYDNDGYLDLYFSVWNAPGRLFHNDGHGTLSEVRLAPTEAPYARGGYASAWGDINNDGFMDLFSADYYGTNYFYLNNLPQIGNSNRWLKVLLNGTASNRSGIGAKIRVKATIDGKTFWQMRQIASHTHLAELMAHFGLGDAAKAEVVRIEWPSGIVQELHNISADQILTIPETSQGASVVEAFNADVNERAGVATVQVQRTTDLQTLVNVDYYTADGTATNGGDYVTTSGTLTFLPGVSNLTVSIPLINDALPETSESFTLVLTNATGGATVSEAHPHIYITDNDLGIRLATNLFVCPENVGSITLTILRGEDENFPATVAYSFINMGTVAGSDYLGTNGVMEFAADEWSKTVTIPILDDLIPEPTESFMFRLGAVTGATILGTPNIAVVRLEDHDTGFQAEQSAYVVRETAGSLVILITRGPDETNAATVDFATQDGTALAGQDYIATNGTLSFAAGELVRSVSLMILHNRVIEPHESFTLVLANPTGMMVLGTNKNVNITIQDNETPTFTQITTGPLVTDPAGGIAGTWIDVDGDGWLDVYVAWAQVPGTSTAYCRLLRNNGNGTFTPITNIVTQTSAAGNMTTWGDYNNDGLPDLFVSRNANDLLFLNQGNFQFTQITTGPLVSDGISSRDCTWIDYNRDGRLDLFVMAGTSTTPLADLLYRNNGGTFTKMTTAEVGSILSNVTGGWSGFWLDINNDGWPDLYRNIETASAHYHQIDLSDGAGRFVPMDIGSMTNGAPLGSTITWGDYDNDGFPDAFILNYQEVGAFYRNLNGQGFTNVLAGSGLPTESGGFVAAWGDCDNDGWLDALMINAVGQPGFLYHNNGDGTFTKTSVSFPANPNSNYGASFGYWGDYDNDGLLDLLFSHAPQTPNWLYRNSTDNGNRWLKIKLNGTSSNRMGIGAKVRVRATINGQTFWQYREIYSAQTYKNNMQYGCLAHFGLGDATVAEVVRIEWPSGIVQELHNISADQILTIPETSQGASVVEGYNANVNERDGVAVVQIQRMTDLDTVVNVSYYTEDGSATNGGDYVATSGTLTFLPGISNVTVSIPLMNDAMPELSEYFTLVLTNATGGATLSETYPRIYVADNDLGIRMSCAAYTNQENAGFAIVTVLRGEDEDFPATVTFSTMNVSAQAGSDYVATNGTLEFAAGELSKTVTITLINDFMPEALESFLFRLGTVTGPTALGGQVNSFIRIVDDDAGIQLEKTVYYVRYNEGSVTIGVTTDAGLSENVSVAYYTSNGTAVAGVDYVATSGTLTFTPGQTYQTVTIPILDDGVITANKSFELRLGTVTGPTALGTNKVATINILELFGMTLTGNRADYMIRNDTPPSYARQQAETLIVGLASFNVNAVFVFELPPLESGANILSAQLSFRLNSVNASPAYNVDLWGIGFQVSTVPIVEYFAGQSGDPDNHKLQDNILTPASPVATWITSATNSGLAAYLQSFYDANPQYGGGSYVFLRLSQDTAVTNSGAYLFVNSADSATPPTLMITASGSDMIMSQQPTSQSASLGALAQFTCTAAGGMPPLTYQWWREAAALPNATGSSLVITNAQLADAGSYYAVIRDGDGMTLTSRVVTLEVDPTFTQITDSPVVNYNTLSAGCLWGDYNHDGYVDLIIPNYGGTLELFHNNGNGTFTRMTAAQVGDMVNTTSSLFANWGDYNNDGHLDVVVSRYTSTEGCVMFRNNGNGSFTRMWARSDAQGGLWGDFNNDGWLDLFPIWVYGSWGQYNCLLQNNQGNGTFTKRTDNPMSANTLNTEGADAVDFDGDGDLDIMLAGYSYQGVACLYRNDGDMHFTRIYNALTTPGLNPLGFAWGDYDNDGLSDVYISRPEGQINSYLFHSDGSGQFSTNTSLEMPVGLGNGAWGDYDNDGDLDLYIWGTYHSSYPSVFYSNNGDGTFTRIMRGSLVNNLPLSAACAWADFDNNGFLDLIVTGDTGNRNSLFHNNGNANKWLLLKLVGTASNRAAIGAKVRTKATIFGKTVWQMREIHGGNRMQNDLRAHFGLGNAAVAEVVRIEWPSGIVQELTNVVAGQILTITEPPRCVAPCVMGGKLEFTLTGNLGDAFELLEADAVDSQSWTVRQTITLTNRTQTISEPANPTATQKYYQIRRVP